MLDEVGVRQPLQEAREIVEGTYNLRAEVLMDLLKRCTSVKTVRLCLQLGRELSLPWAAKLDETVLPKGSARAWISKSRAELQRGLDAEEREFLLSIACNEPNWGLLGIEHLEHLPAIRWTLENLERLAKSNGRKFEKQVQELERLLGRS